MKVLILVHLILSTIFIVIFYNKDKLIIPTIGYSLIVLGFPIGGPCMAYVLYSLNSKSYILETKYDPIDFFNNESIDFKFLNLFNMEEEIKVIPIQKALMEDDLIKRRESVLNLTKKDINNYTNLMNMALFNEDSETSHYAASSILNSKRKLDNNMNIKSKLYKENINDSAIIISYADQLMEAINSGYIDYDVKRNYIDENINILKRIVDERLDLDIRHPSNLIDLLLMTEDYEGVYTYTDILNNEYPNSEKKYLQILKSYYLVKDFNNFNLSLENFISSNIKFSKDTVDIVRFWLGG